MDNAAGSASVELKRTLLWISGTLWLISGAWYLLAEAVAALGFPGYSYARNYISDLGVPGAGSLDGRELNSRLHAVMNAGFLGEALFVLLAAIVLCALLSRGQAATLLSLVGVHVAGITLVGLVPGSPENAANGLMVFHGLGAVLAISAGNLAAILAGSWVLKELLPGTVRALAVALGLIGFSGALLLTLQLWLPDGVWERTAVYAFILWHLILGVSLLGKAWKRPEKGLGGSPDGPADGRASG